MNDLSIREIIEHSQRVEQESYAFYTQAVGIVRDEAVKPLLRELAEEEIRHYNLLGALLDQDKIDEADLAARVGLDTDLYNRFVKTHEITASSSQQEVLSIALERETNTEALYAMLLTFTNLSDEIIRVFENLRLQEVGHANRIRSLMG